MPRMKAAADKAAPKPDGVQAILHAVALLEALAQSAGPVRLTDLARQLDTTKARVFRHLQTFVAQGYATQDSESGHYRSGPKLILLGQLAIENLGLVNQARPVMQELRESLGHSVILSQLAAEKLYTVEVLRGTSPFAVTSLRGSSQELHATALGKIALAFGPASLLARVCAEDLAAVTPQTITDARKLARQVKQIVERGYAVSPNEYHIGINGLAAPIFDSSGKMTGAIAVLDMLHLLPDAPARKQIRAVQQAAQDISKRMGYVSAHDGPRDKPAKK